MKSNVFTDYDIQALVDDELAHEKAKQVLAFIDQSPYARKRYEELTEQKELLKLWWGTSRH